MTWWKLFCLLRHKQHCSACVAATVALGHGVYRKLYTFTGGQRAEKFENHCSNKKRDNNVIEHYQYIRLCLLDCITALDELVD